jgi:hypothetical protein
MDTRTRDLTNINDFFDAYAAAMEQHDTKLMTRFYDIPCTMLADEQSSIFTEINKLEGLFNQAMVSYTQLGIRHFNAELRNRRQISDRLYDVTILWHYRDAHDQLVYSCRYHYILRTDKQHHWKIQVAVSVDEKQQLDRWLAERPISLK